MALNAAQLIADSYGALAASDFDKLPVSNGGKCPPANRTSSQPRPAAKSAAASRPSAAATRPSSTGQIGISSGFLLGKRTGSGRRGVQSSALATAGALLAGNNSRPTTPNTPDSGYKEGSSAPVVPRVVQPTETREEVCARLQRTPFLEHGAELFMHGRGYTGPKVPANVTWKSDKPPRKDHHAPDWLTATEFEDTHEVASAKCKQLATLMRLSKKTVLYTGAGISASVIGQAALSGQNKVGWKPDKMKAKPTFTHHALGFLGRQGLVHSWVQQNHDGLPQKGGCPQECINEIHGSWYDPSNPVVKYSGTLHSRACPWMEDDAETADLVIVLGTSLGGLNADQVATNAAERSCSGYRGPRGALGTVIINLQQTSEDGSMTLRLFGRSDDLLPMLLQELGFPPLQPRATHWPKESRALVPYDSNGKRLPEGAPKMWLDLSDGANVKITPGHNIQGAKQPQYMHIGAKKGKSAPGLGSVRTRDESTSCFMLDIEGASMRLGLWWLDSAVRGAVEALPVVNQKPLFESAEGPPPRAGVCARRSTNRS